MQISIKKQKEEALSGNLGLLVKTSIIVLITMFLSKIISYIYRIVIARYLGPEIYGSLMLLMAVLGLFISFGSLGISEGLQRYVPKNLGQKRPDRAHYIINLSFKISIISGLISAAILFLFSDYISSYLFKDLGFSIILKYSALLIPIWLYSNLFLSVINSLEKIGWYSFLSDVLPSVSRLILLIALLFLGINENAAYLSYGLSLVIMCIASYYVFKFFAKKVFLNEMNNEEEKRKIRAEFFAYSWPIIFTSILIKISFWLDSITIGYFLSPVEVGFYNAAIPLAALLSVIPELFSPMFFPLINREIAKGKKEMVNQLSKQVNKWIFLLNLPIFMMFFIFPGAFINLFFGENYLPAENALRILSVGLFASSFLTISSKLLLMKGKSKLLLINSSISIIFNLLLNIILIPIYGITGAAIATTSFIILLGLIQIVEAYYFTKILPFRRSMIRIVLASILPFLLLIYLKQEVQYSLFNLTMVSLFFFLSYFLLATLFTLDKHDKVIFHKFKIKLFKKVAFKKPKI